MLLMACNENGFHSQISTKLNVGEGITDDQAGIRRDPWKIYLGLFKEAGEWFTAVALLFVVRAKVEGVDVRPVFCEHLIQLRMDRSDVFRAVKAQRNAALVGDYDYAQAGLVQFGYRFRDAWE